MVQAPQGRLLQAAGPAEPRRHGARDHVVRHALGAGCGRGLRTQTRRPAGAAGWGSGRGPPGATVLFSWSGVPASARAASGGSSAPCGRIRLRSDTVPAAARFSPAASSTTSTKSDDGLKKKKDDMMKRMCVQGFFDKEVQGLWVYSSAFVMCQASTCKWVNHWMSFYRVMFKS